MPLKRTITDVEKEIKAIKAAMKDLPHDGVTGACPRCAKNKELQPLIAEYVTFGGSEDAAAML